MKKQKITKSLVFNDSQLIDVVEEPEPLLSHLEKREYLEDDQERETKPNEQESYIADNSSEVEPLMNLEQLSQTMKRTKQRDSSVEPLIPKLK